MCLKVVYTLNVSSTKFVLGMEQNTVLLYLHSKQYISSVQFRLIHIVKILAKNVITTSLDEIVLKVQNI